MGEKLRLANKGNRPLSAPNHAEVHQTQAWGKNERAKGGLPKHAKKKGGALGGARDLLEQRLTKNFFSKERAGPYFPI